MSQIEAMKLALEALEYGLDYAENENFENKLKFRGYEHLMPSDAAESVEQINIAITAIRQAIEQAQKQEPVAKDWRKEPWGFGEKHIVTVQEDTSPPQRQPNAKDFEDYCKTLHPLWNTRMSRTEAERFFHAGWLAAHGIKGEA